MQDIHGYPKSRHSETRFIIRASFANTTSIRIILGMFGERYEYSDEKEHDEVFLLFISIHYINLHFVALEALVGLGGTTIHGGAGHYGWFDLSTSEVDSTEYIHQVKGLLNIEYQGTKKVPTGKLAVPTTLLPIESITVVQESIEIALIDEERVLTTTSETSQLSLPLVGIDAIWSSDAGQKILLVNLDAITTKIAKRKLRMNAIAYMARQADFVFIAGQRKMVEDARPYLAEFSKRAEMIETGPAGITKYLLRSAKKVARSGATQFAITSNEQVFSELGKLGRVTIISPNISSISKQLLNLSSAVLDIQSLADEAKKFTPVPKVYIPSIVLPKVSIDDIWHPDAGQKVLLVDLDNLITQKACFVLRMEAIVAIARTSDHVFIAGQKHNVDRAVPHLAEFADVVVTVRFGRDVADRHLLKATKSVRSHGCAQFAVSSNDHIFSTLGNRGRLTIISPHVEKIAEDLLKEAVAVFDLREVEGDVRQPSPSGPDWRKVARKKRLTLRETESKLRSAKSVPAPIAIIETETETVKPRALPDVPQFTWNPSPLGSTRKTPRSSIQASQRRAKSRPNHKISGERRAQLEQAKAIQDRLEIQTLAI